MKPLIIFSLLAATGFLHAQPAPLWEPEVRKAIPVETPTPAPEYNNPEWMQRVPRAIPVATPEPADTPYRPTGRLLVKPPQETAPSPTPTPTSPARPAAQPEAQSIPVAESADDPNSIRIRPTGPGRDEAADQLAKANSVYARKMYDFAASEYEKFLSDHPQASGRDTALFRLGECHRRLGQSEAARKAYTRLAQEFHEGEFYGAGAYRLGEAFFNDGKFDEALVQFRAAHEQSREDEVRLSANYQAARSLDRLGQPAEAAALFREVADVADNNPYRQYARMALADSLSASDAKKEALGIYAGVVENATTPAMTTEAAVKAAALASELGDPDRADKFYKTVLASDDNGPWKSVGIIGSLRFHASNKDNHKVIATPQGTIARLSGDNLAEAYTILAAANKAEGDNVRALEYYKKLIAEFPESKAAASARFERVLALHDVGDPSARSELEAFVKSTPQGAQHDRASLLLAELSFKDGDYAAAASQYQALLSADLPETIMQQVFYKRAWCLAQSGDPAAAVTAYSAMLEKYPTSEMLPTVHLQRGLARRQAKDYKAALEDFQKILNDWPKAPVRESALENVALIQGQLEDFPAMKKSFTQFLAEFPESKGRAHAEFWIGWADFEAKDYKAALPHFVQARQLDPSNYSERAGLRIALCQYYLGDRAALAKELTSLKPEAIPKDVLRWLGLRSALDGDFSTAERTLAALVQSGSADPETLVTLAESRNALGKYEEAVPTAEAYLKGVTDPAPRARGLLALANAQRGTRNFDKATEAVNEALQLQPEGRLNAAGRMTSAEIEFSLGQFDAAARAFVTVALLYDDPAIAPRALQRAVEAYRRDGNTTEAERTLDELKSRFPDNTLSKTP